MPTLDGSYFGRSLTYICEHDSEGAMGLVVNKTTEHTLDTVLEQIEDDIYVPDQLSEHLIMAGGPVQTDRGFILHNGEKTWSSSLKMSSEITVTTSKDILSTLTTAKGPEKFLVTLGYAGWSPGQLEQELAENAWLTVDADPELIFNTPVEQRWEKALALLGITPEQLSHLSGHA